jgi:hypothetical protein
MLLGSVSARLQRDGTCAADNLCVWEHGGSWGWRTKGRPPAMKDNNSSVALVRERTIPTERTPLVDEVGANFCG